MPKKQQLEGLKAALFGTDGEAARQASDRIFRFGGRFNKTGRRKCRRYLISILDQEGRLARNSVALTFRKHRFNAAVNPLLRAITKPENARGRGTLVYALEKLDCSQKLGELFAILFGAAGNWEVQASALNILEEQIFEFSRDELRTIGEQWEAVKPQWNKLNKIDENDIGPMDIHRDLIQSYVDGYLAYLKY